MISITILLAHKEKGHGAHFVCPISDLAGHLAAILFVDDTDIIIHMNLRGDESVAEAHASLQDSIYNWGQLLIATGGAFKPPKCFYYLISYGWKASGAWKYEANELNEELDIAVPMPDGTSVPIEHLSVDTLRVRLWESSRALLARRRSRTSQ